MDIKPPSTIHRHRNHNPESTTKATTTSSPVVGQGSKIRTVKNEKNVQSEKGQTSNSSGLKEKNDMEQATGDSNEIIVYKRRYYILLTFSMIAFMQYCCWNTFGPISTTCIEVFQWSEQEIALMASLDPITYILTIYFFSWMMDVKGLSILSLLDFFFFSCKLVNCRWHSKREWKLRVGKLGGNLIYYLMHFISFKSVCVCGYLNIF